MLQDWEERLNKQAPASLTAAALLLVIVSVLAVVYHGLAGTLSKVEEILLARSLTTWQSSTSLLQMDMLVDRKSRMVVYMPKAHKIKQSRMQSLAAQEEEEEEAPAIRYENDYKVGGGDLEVPVSMVDYDNLGEGSIVDQRYPRKLPGQSSEVLHSPPITFKLLCAPYDPIRSHLISSDNLSRPRRAGSAVEWAVQLGEAEGGNAPAAGTRVANKNDANNENKVRGAR
eukprot:753336-Hanusia_phi.AAC.4